MIYRLNVGRVNIQARNKFLINNTVFRLVSKYLQGSLIKLLLIFYRKYLLFVHWGKDKPGLKDFYTRIKGFLRFSGLFLLTRLFS